jgi:hypothetical protein
MPTTKKTPKLKIRSSTNTTQTKKHEVMETDERGIKSLFTWEAPERIWEPKGRMWYLVSALIVMLVILFAVVSQYPSYPVLVLAMLLFLVMWFVQGSISPQVIVHRITNKGLFSREILYHWEDMSHFWIADKKGQFLMHLDFRQALNLPRQTFLIRRENAQEIFDLMVAKIKYADVNEAQYNIIARTIYGEYLPISKFIPDLDKE